MATPGITNNNPGSERQAAYSLAVVVPCFNESGRINVAAFCDFLKQHSGIRLVFVNDGSTDTTKDVLEKIRSRAPDAVELIHLPANKGKAEAVRIGILNAIGSGVRFAGYWDADLATPLEEVPRLMAILTSERDVYAVLGSRVQLLGTTIVRSATRHYLGRVFATAASLALRIAVYDTQCGAKLFRLNPAVCRAFETPFSGRWIFDVELLGRMINLTSASGNGPRGHGVVELPVRKWVDVKGSRLTFTDCIRSAWDLALLAMRGIR